MVTVLVVAGLCMFAVVDMAARPDKPSVPTTIDLTNLLRKKRR